MNDIRQFDYAPLFRFCRIKRLPLHFILTLNQYTAILQRLYFGLELVDPFWDRRNVYTLLPKLYQSARLIQLEGTSHVQIDHYQLRKPEFTSRRPGLRKRGT